MISSGRNCSPPVGGFDFAAGADRSPSPERFIWTEQALPRVLHAIGLSEAPEQNEFAFRLSDLRGADIWRSQSRRYVVWQAGPETHRLVVDGGSDLNAIALPFDEVFETRLDAARSFWRAVTGRPARPAYGSLPAQTRARHILNLRVHDGRQAGATYRQIADALLSREPIAQADWRDHPLKHKVRAILKRTDRLIAGGYCDLLFYPHRRGRNSA